MKHEAQVPTVAPTHAARSRVGKAYGKASSTPPESQEALLQMYLPIVKSIVSKIKINLPPHIEEDDLYSVGLAGLISALKKYDPSQQKSFGSYAAMRIRGAILDELRRMDWMPRNARTNFKRLRKTVEEIEQRLGRPATEEEVRAELQLSPKEYSALLDEVRPISFVPLDSSPNGEDGDEPNLYEVIADDSLTSATDKMEKDELVRMVAERINQLPEVPRKVLAMYYYEDMRLAEIAAVFGLTESRICQIHSQAILSLRTYLTNIMHK
ncbi:FliA/WhiG family RNA polymerase sigma factor [Opitutales bacterium ASA1]|jgi:RNA polymerase sigma factor for flagellar operon FliA|uniref:sigma-70 family RNA polymerase sigma factor n=1 Tax=Congregicoccus parvus TaxID=3081749 RepID=UPI002B285E19|nr:FliA/WhiG family RNA polymerase sigma factor [Opitutales bacterium ASA1]